MAVRRRRRIAGLLVFLVVAITARKAGPVP